MNGQLKRVHLRVRGLVQGVCYRAYTQDQAESLQLCGWVRNLPSGDVEVVAEGPEQALQQLCAWCRRGPPAAEVSDVQIGWHEATGEFLGFSIRR